MTEVAKRSPEELIGQIVNGYKIAERIAESMVFLAFKEDTPAQQVAFKVFYPDPFACNREIIVERLRAVEKLDDENIVKVYEVGEEEDFVYVVMEYVPGQNLYDLMQRNPRLHWGAAAELARDIVQGLRAAHKNNVLHLSLHPDRVLLGKEGQIKITFCNEGEITPSKEIVQYVAPELFRGQQLEATGDIYALGAIIYNIVIGKAPLAGKEPKDVAKKHRERQPVLPSYGVEDIPHSLSTILTRSLNVDTKKRYGHCVELGAAFRNFLKNDIGKYQLGSYKELFKIVEVSESDKSFTRKVKKHQRLVTETQESINPAEEQEKTEKEEDNIKQGIPWLVIILCALSLLLNISLALFIKNNL